MEKEVKVEKKLSVKVEIAIVIVSILALVGFYFLSIAVQKTEAKTTVKEELDNLKNGIFDTEGMNETEIEIYKAFYKNLEYEILDTKADYTKATVKVKVSNKNMGKVINSYYIKAKELGIDFQAETVQLNEEIEQYLLELLKSEEIENLDTIANVSLSKNNGEWTFDNDTLEDFYEAILPGLQN